jgi:hypothetical protein
MLTPASRVSREVSTGADRGPRAGSPRGVVDATGYTGAKRRDVIAATVRSWLQPTKQNDEARRAEMFSCRSCGPPE